MQGEMKMKEKDIGQQDSAILDARAEALNAEAEDVLRYQAPLPSVDYEPESPI